MKDSISIFKEIISLIKTHGLLLILYLIMLFSISTNSIHIYIKIVFCILTLLYLHNKYKFAKNYVALLLFSILYCFLMAVYGIIPSVFETFSLLIGPPAFFLFGYAVVDKSKSSNEIYIFILLTIITSSFVLWTNNIQDALDVGIINTSRLVLNEMGIVEQSATLQGSIASIALLGISYPIVTSKYRNIVSLLFVVSAFLSLFCIIHLVNRSGLFVGVAIVTISILYTARYNKLSIFFLVSALIIVYSALSYYNVFDESFVDAYEAREIDSSISSGSKRFDIWPMAFSYMLQYPFGWTSVPNFGYCHNMWLDIARCTGIVPFFYFVILSWKNYKTTYYLYKEQGVVLNGMIVALSVGTFLSAFIEPVIESVSSYYYLICLFWGMQQAWVCKPHFNY